MERSGVFGNHSANWRTLDFIDGGMARIRAIVPLRFTADSLCGVGLTGDGAGCRV